MMKKHQKNAKIWRKTAPAASTQTNKHFPRNCRMIVSTLVGLYGWFGHWLQKSSQADVIWKVIVFKESPLYTLQKSCYQVLMFWRNSWKSPLLGFVSKMLQIQYYFADQTYRRHKWINIMLGFNSCPLFLSSELWRDVFLLGFCSKSTVFFKNRWFSSNPPCTVQYCIYVLVQK